MSRLWKDLYTGLMGFGLGCRNSRRKPIPQAPEALVHLFLDLPKGTGGLVKSAQLHV